MLVRQEIPATNIVLARSVGQETATLLRSYMSKKRSYKLAKKEAKKDLFQMTEQSENPLSPSGQVVSGSSTASEKS